MPPAKGGGMEIIMEEKKMTIEEMLERLKNDPSWCDDEATRALIAGQLANTIIES